MKWKDAGGIAYTATSFAKKIAKDFKTNENEKKYYFIIRDDFAIL